MSLNFIVIGQYSIKIPENNFSGVHGFLSLAVRPSYISISNILLTDLYTFR